MRWHTEPSMATLDALVAANRATMPKDGIPGQRREPDTRYVRLFPEETHYVTTSNLRQSLALTLLESKGPMRLNTLADRACVREVEAEKAMRTMSEGDEPGYEWTWFAQVGPETWALTAAGRAALRGGSR